MGERETQYHFFFGYIKYTYIHKYEQRTPFFLMHILICQCDKPPQSNGKDDLLHDSFGIQALVSVAFANTRYLEI